MVGPLRPERDDAGTLVHVIETLLDKGLVINADILVSVAGVELLGVRLRAALASFETAARYGLEFPAGTNTSTLAWRRAAEPKDTCPQCGKESARRELLEESCPWCGWRSARVLARERAPERLEPGAPAAPTVARPALPTDEAAGPRGVGGAGRRRGRRGARPGAAEESGG